MAKRHSSENHSHAKTPRLRARERAGGEAHAGDSKIEKKQTEIRNKTRETLKACTKQIQRPSRRSKAVFGNMGMNVLVAGSGSGKGMAVDNKAKHESFMEMLELQARV